ncbi:hypothetical protein SAMN06297251_10455 [Fulvimarina manganoxydans]|uniref:Head decoration protein n=1 Tax=Fulvimarina manganoxydans TaxID=937218 RepID=A0A1W2AD34_9HYPH|nr:hypothetical protein [Fulvimarina manganoxydans]SMC58158.1 hypothetical protein SAMN06297251_10455 [Fulvimarina manganoxydans]
MDDFTVVSAAPAEPHKDTRFEPTHRTGSHLAWEVSADFCRKSVDIDNSAGTDAIMPGTVLRDGNDDLVGVLYGPAVPAGESVSRTVTHRGPVIVNGRKLIFPVIADVAADPDATPPVAAVDGAAETAALEDHLREQIEAAGISIQ